VKGEEGRYDLLARLMGLTFFTLHSSPFTLSYHLARLMLLTLFTLHFSPFTLS